MDQPTNKLAPEATVPDSQPPMAKKTKWPLIGLIVGGVVVVGLGVYFWANSQKAKPAAENRVIKVGLIGPLAGDNVAVGLGMKQAIELAIKDYNQEGITIKLVTRDTGCSPDKATAATKELIETEKVAAIIGDVCSGATLAAGVVANEHHVPIISPGSTSPKVTDAGDYVFRSVPSDSFQGSFGAKLMYQAGNKRLGIFFSNEAYGSGLAAVVKADFEKLGGKVVAYESAERDTTDVQTAMARIKAASPDAIYIVTNSQALNSAALLRAQAVSLKAKLYGSEGLKDQTILIDAATAAEGLSVTSLSEGNADFVAKYREAYSTEGMASYAAQTYDAFAALAQTFKQGAFTSEQIKTKLYGVDFKGVSGHIKFDANGDLSNGSYSVYVVKDRKYVLTPQ